MDVVTRFAPSPTGNLHIGGLRTAIFNFLYARRHGGKFLLRIEDTDLARSNTAYLESILQALKWLSLSYDELVYQSVNVNRHREVALELLNRGKAYHDNGAVRLKVNHDETVKFSDLILGEISADGDSINDVVILRSDGSPTYMLAVVVDDHDMGITHIIRGSDHITNTFAQKLIYEGMGWSLPDFAHIPLIHNTHGAKLSKRDGAVDVIDYRTAGILPEAMFNYLLRLGWSHGDKEIFSIQEAIDLFDITAVGKSPARFDREKLYSLNSYYISGLPLERIASEVRSLVEEKIIVSYSAFIAFVELFRKKCSSIVELKDNLQFCWCTDSCLEVDRLLLQEVLKLLENTDWGPSLQQILKEYISLSGFSAKEVYTNLRMALIGQEHSPSVVEIMQIFGKDVVLKKLRNSLK
ncbi:glutamate--tRNA ligase [Neorickettsia sennetsu]|uniref:Glutamate--tRNA ligase 2 n=1 Tax=Ehrlichia sennetsu (strain ATCC VR-367 / Miyayama) TaxID=222891 RepID=SYE2_EHRS3|nr:glutamate--tRNA ligase [Neorickettsia sennetsu]Q2GD33.1 RecName: Full=Glutamate--tRNA ligase 2; AltName: Full=Glutamyl-tRNA synthetase 2; Short=GluRS 2 [Neorickettsia sennetsu str. Miyayama]ABD46317.1 glutamyl-tRNA synthetase [Neorickettsia sennetsu str. Miyayama]